MHAGLSPDAKSRIIPLVEGTILLERGWEWHSGHIPLQKGDRIELSATANGRFYGGVFSETSYHRRLQAKGPFVFLGYPKVAIHDQLTAGDAGTFRVVIQDGLLLGDPIFVQILVTIVHATGTQSSDTLGRSEFLPSAAGRIVKIPPPYSPLNPEDWVVALVAAGLVAMVAVDVAIAKGIGGTVLPLTFEADGVWVAGLIALYVLVFRFSNGYKPKKPTQWPALADEIGHSDDHAE